MDTRSASWNAWQKWQRHGPLPCDEETGLSWMKCWNVFFSISACFQNEGRLNGENLQGFDYLHIAHSGEENLFNRFERSNFRGNAEGTALWIFPFDSRECHTSKDSWNHSHNDLSWGSQPDKSLKCLWLSDVNLAVTIRMTIALSAQQAVPGDLRDLIKLWSRLVLPTKSFRTLAFLEKAKATKITVSWWLQAWSLNPFHPLSVLLGTAQSRSRECGWRDTSGLGLRQYEANMKQIRNHAVHSVHSLRTKSHLGRFVTANHSEICCHPTRSWGTSSSHSPKGRRFRVLGDMFGYIWIFALVGHSKDGFKALTAWLDPLWTWLSALLLGSQRELQEGAGQAGPWGPWASRKQFETDNRSGRTSCQKGLETEKEYVLSLFCSFQTSDWWFGLDSELFWKASLRCRGQLPLSSRPLCKFDFQLLSHSRGSQNLPRL